MTTAIIILLFVALGTLLFKFSGKEVSVGLFVLYGVVLAILLIGAFRWQVKDETYTGYVYSRSSLMGYTTYHIRMSQHSGTDAQPSFTAKAGSPEEKKLNELVGSDTKTKVTVKSGAPRLVENPFEPHGLVNTVE